ncbi:MAG: hypothetical protein ACHP8A_16200 [Terriglobales bacterium]
MEFSTEFWTGIAFAILALVLGLGVNVAMDARTKHEFWFVVICFVISACISCCGIASWELDTAAKQTIKIPLAIALFVLTGMLTLATIRWAYRRHKRASQAEKKVPSLLFVFGAPLGDNNSPTWIMMLRHFGPNSAHNCTIDFYDDDRKNLEHEWLVKHPNSPFLPPGMFDESRKTIHIAEAGPEGSTRVFEWVPLDPDRQHYSVSISCRDGVFVEKWEVTRINGVLRTKITIEHGLEWARKNPKLERVIFKCEDMKFSSTPLAIRKPNTIPPQVHPGWKPNHRFEVPVAIVDSNGNIQTMSAVELPDGSTKSDFGCWNILTMHYGDNSRD